MSDSKHVPDVHAKHLARLYTVLFFGDNWNVFPGQSFCSNVDTLHFNLI
jgi:hypothetical protein